MGVRGLQRFVILDYRNKKGGPSPRKHCVRLRDLGGRVLRQVGVLMMRRCRVWALNFLFPQRWRLWHCCGALRLCSMAVSLSYRKEAHIGLCAQSG